MGQRHRRHRMLLSCKEDWVVVRKYIQNNKYFVMSIYLGHLQGDYVLHEQFKEFCTTFTTRTEKKLFLETFKISFYIFHDVSI
jgi:hypothetical protein